MAHPRPNSNKSPIPPPIVPSKRKSEEADVGTHHTKLSRADGAGRPTARNPVATVGNLDLAQPFSSVSPALADGQPIHPHPPKDHALVVLERLFESHLSLDEYVIYEKMISDLVRRGSKELALRIRSRPALQSFFKEHPQAMALHNDFARLYNKAFKGKHERFHLPMFEPQVAGQTGMAYANAYDSHQQQYREQADEGNVGLNSR
jgi:hypothetical protein